MGQNCGIRNEGPEKIKKGMVYVIHAAIRDNDVECNKLCQSLPADGVPCVSWTYSYITKKCVINNLFIKVRL